MVNLKNFDSNNLPGSVAYIYPDIQVSFVDILGDKLRCLILNERNPKISDSLTAKLTDASGICKIISSGIRTFPDILIEFENMENIGGGFFWEAKINHIEMRR